MYEPSAPVPPLSVLLLDDEINIRKTLAICLDSPGPRAAAICCPRGTRAGGAMRALLLSISCFTLFALPSTSAFGLDPGKRLTQFVHGAWGMEEGLPQSFIQAILQTRDGYLWVGTEEGLARFDGVRFVVFNRWNSEGLPDNFISALLEDADGDLWIGTRKGACVMRDGRFRPRRFGPAFDSTMITAIAQDNSRRIWLGSMGEGMVVVEEKSQKHYRTMDGLVGDDVSCIFPDADGSVWIGTYDHGVSVYRKGCFFSLEVGDDESLRQIAAFGPGPRGETWIGTRTAGLYLYSNGILQRFDAPENLPEKAVQTLLTDRDGALWIGTYGGGLSRLSKSRIEVLAHIESLAQSVIGALCEDAEGSLWIGTHGEGLFRLKEGVFTSWTVREGLSNDMVFSLFEDGAGVLWIGTRGGGLNFLKDGAFGHLRIAEGPSDDIIISIGEDREEGLWVGTHRGGVNRRVGKRWSIYTRKDGLAADRVSAIFTDRGGTLWIGTHEGGFHRWRNGRFIAYPTERDSPMDIIRAIAEDGEGTLWLAVKGGGLASFKDGRYRFFGPEDGLADNEIMSLYADTAGALWIGTYGGGLNLLRHGSGAVFTSKDGLASDVVYQILEDDAGRLWMSGNRGIAVVLKRDVLAYADRRLGAIPCRLYDTSDGMMSGECNGGFQHAGWKTRDGRLWFPTIKGLVVADPDRLPVNTRPPPVVVEEVMVDHLPAALGVNDVFPAGSSTFEFHYTALSLTAPEKNRFRYRLEDFDRDWVEAGGRRTAYYTNLPPGHYVFRVIACNNDGVWNRVGATYTFYSKPRFHQTPWFYLLIGMGTFIIGWILYRARVNVLTARSAVLEERNRLAREIHDTLAQGFTGIKLQLQAAKMKSRGTPNEAAGHVEKAIELTQHGLEEAGRSLWALRPRALEREGLPGALQEMVHPLFSDPSVKFAFTMEGRPIPLKGETELNLLRIAQEAVMNAIKHAHATTIELSLHYGKRHLQMTVADDGVGLPPAAPDMQAGHGFGLSSMTQRIKNLGGRLTVRSRPGCGLEIEVNLPLRSNISSWGRRRRALQ